jgi:hypothetical protein
MPSLCASRKARGKGRGRWRGSVVTSFARKYLLAWNRVTRFADRFFFDEDAFTFKGIMTFAIQMLGSVLGICTAIQLFAHPADVRARNFEPVGCLDINQYEESFALMGVEYPKKLREIIDRFVNKTEGEKVYGPRHDLICWYVTPRSKQRQQEVREDTVGQPPYAEYQELPCRR